MISKLCVNTGSVSVGRRKWRPFIEFYLCISESIVIYNTYINVHIYLLKTRLMHILKFASQLVKPRCKRIVSIYLIYRIHFYQLSWVFWKCKVLIVKLSFFLFNVLKRDNVMVLFLDIAILNFKMYQQMEEKPQNTLGSHWQAVRTEMCGSGI